MRQRLSPQAAALLRRIFNDVGLALERDEENVARVVPTRTIAPSPPIHQTPSKPASSAAFLLGGGGEFSHVCAWCAPASEGKRAKAKGKNASHGICPACVEKYFPRPQSAANSLPCDFVGEPVRFACPVGLGVTGAGSFERSFPR